MQSHNISIFRKSRVNKAVKSACILALSFFGLGNLNAQSKTGDTMSFTVIQAIDFAMSNNPDVKNAYADVAIANQTVKEVTAIGIPQLKGNIAFQDAIEKQVFVFPQPGPNGSFIPTPIRVGNKYTTQASLNFSWLILDGTYFLGLKSAKQFTDLSKKMASKTETDVKIDIAKSYFMCLITKENISLVNSTYNTLNKTFTQVKALNKEGFTESLDVDRMQLQINNLKINQQKLQDQYQILLGLLKTKMGLDPNKPIKLMDDISDLNERFNLTDTSGTINLKERTDYQVLQQNLTLNKLNVKRFQYGKYPNLVGAFTYQQSNFGEKIDYGTWYSNSFLALQVNVPIFSGFANDAKIQKAKIEVIKSEQSIKKVENLIALDAMQSKLKYLRAIELVQQQKENLDLANRILNVTTIKYNEGVGSNLELITANQDLKTTQTNYLSAVYDLLVAKLDLLVATGQQIKF